MINLCGTVAMPNFIIIIAMLITLSSFAVAKPNLIIIKLCGGNA